MRQVLTTVWRWSAVLALFLGLALAWRTAAADVGVRTWTSANGHECRAKFLRFEGRSQVIVEREKDGKPLTLTIRELSAADRAYLKELRTALAQEGEGVDEALDAAEPAKPVKPTPADVAAAPPPTPKTAGKAATDGTPAAGKVAPGGAPAAGKAPAGAPAAGKVGAGVGIIAWFLTVVGVVALLTGAVWLTILAFKQSRSWGAFVLCGALAAPCLVGSIPLGIFVYRQRADQAVRISALLFGGGVLFWVIGLGLLFFAWR